MDQTCEHCGKLCGDYICGDCAKIKLVQMRTKKWSSRRLKCNHPTGCLISGDGTCGWCEAEKLIAAAYSIIGCAMEHRLCKNCKDAAIAWHKEATEHLNSS